ncbi:MAG TPA: tetratricopeptide repeat protein [Candidatus Limenecus avicola]|jgi:TPR repeat:HAT (half-A-TPR) repeat|uniref:Tetratricopeptide repeat protein n=1 Tax=Candidatus Limenecus avicola TaxID=2840847 RepID=A0A9D1SR49_9CLOT|nr:tetratricopeptide repeat protein [Candidatus Limenecus avicola]
MKKVVLLITILFVSVISTACINNLAVQELNNKAKEYMANGETEKAICRLRSSIDLDTSIFETHYNLGVALIEVKEYAEAQASLENAIKLKPDFADSYYSLAMAMENQADDIINGRTNEDKTLNAEQTEETAQQADAKAKKELTEAEKNKVVELLNGAVDNYNKYIVKKPDAEDKDKVEEQIRFVNEQIGQYNSLRSNAMPDVENASTSTNLEGSEN